MGPQLVIIDPADRWLVMQLKPIATPSQLGRIIAREDSPPAVAMLLRGVFEPVIRNGMPPQELDRSTNRGRS